MAGALQVDVGAVAVGEVLDDLLDVLLGDVDGDVGAALLGELELLRRHVERDDVHRVLGSRAGDHAEPDGSAAGHHDGVLEGDLARSTACSEQDSGSANAACAGGMSPETLCTNASTG